jgi:hypothetical protein
MTVDDGGGFHSNRWPQSAEELAKIRVVLEPDAPYEAETMWARPIGDGLFVLDNVPFFAYGLSLGDRVYARPMADSILEYSGVAARGGHSTYRVVLDESAGTRAEEYWQELQELGCEREIAASRLWAFDLGSGVDIHRVYRVLEKAEAEGTWTFEEAHVGHDVG